MTAIIIKGRSGGGSGTTPSSQIIIPDLLCPFNSNFNDLKNNSITLRNSPTISAIGGITGLRLNNPTEAVNSGRSLVVNSSIVFGNNDFCIEAWANLTGTNGNSQEIFCTTSTSGNFAQDIQFGFFNSRIFRATYYSVNQYYALLETPNPLNVNTWYHLAYSRQGNTYRLFVDGVLQASSQNAGRDLPTTTRVNIGCAQPGSFIFYFNGYISNLRVINGAAQYTSNFTPPALGAPLSLI